MEVMGTLVKGSPSWHHAWQLVLSHLFVPTPSRVTLYHSFAPCDKVAPIPLEENSLLPCREAKVTQGCTEQINPQVRPRVQ